MRNELKMFIIFSVIVLLGLFFQKPIKKYFYDMLPNQSAQEERENVGSLTVVNPRVKEVQEMLKTLKYYSGNIDGKIGEKTRKALENFQKDNNITVTGRIDNKTKSSLTKLVISQGKVSKNLDSKNKVSNENKINFNIKDVQKLLREAGFYFDETDGIMGPKTTKALKDFQKEKGLEQSGKIDSPTLTELKKIEKRR